MIPSINRSLALVLEEIAAMYRFHGLEDRFRQLAYARAATTIGRMQEDIKEHIRKGTLVEIPGIGESIAEKIIEFVKTGRIKLHERLKKEVPYELLELMDIKGLGPRTLSVISGKLKLRTKGELIKALHDGSVSKLKGFGAKKTEAILRGMKLHKTLEERMLLWDALVAGNEVLDTLRDVKGVLNIELCGSLRRRKETIGDIDVLVSAARGGRGEVLKRFTSSSLATRVLASGPEKASVILRKNGRQCDLRLADEQEWGSALQYFTGSKEHNIALRTLAKEKGYKISEYGIFGIKNNRRYGGAAEEDIYKVLGMEFIPPEMRENRGEIELALKKALPALVKAGDIRGDLQMHSNWSDGAESIDKIAAYLKKNFHYEYMALTDHSRSLRVAGGLDVKDIRKQLKAIEEINRKNGDRFVKSGIEVEILKDGSLDLPDEILMQLDWVTASVHSGFSHDNTERLIRACENPWVCCIGHPTGRLIGSREAYGVDVKSLFEAAVATGTCLEINAQPGRMDLSDELAFRAREVGVKLVISTDSHSLADLHFMETGVAIARRAWCRKQDVLNTQSWQEVEKYRDKKRVKRKVA